MSGQEEKANAEDIRHTWNFARVGGVNRVNLETGMDLINLEHLDQKLWTALSCPVYGLEIDHKTLELIDSDKDKRIRVPEIINAVKWVVTMIKNPDELTKGYLKLPLNSISDSTPEGKTLLDSARQILTNLGTPGATEISVEETSDTVKIFANTRFNGDGIITAESADDEKTKALISDIIACMGSLKDRSGKEGINSDHITAFFKACEDYSKWRAKAESDAGSILPFGDDTLQALNAFLAVKAKIDDYFIRCRLAEYNPESSDTLKSLTERFEEIRLKDLSVVKDELASLPIATISNNSLNLAKGINPAWEDAISQFRKTVLEKIFPVKEKITAADMDAVEKKFSAFRAWQAEKTGEAVEKLGLEKVREITGGKGKEDLLALIDSDKAMEEKANNIFLVDKLVRYYRDIYRLLRNYVTFHDFYSPETDAIFQAGKLYIDQRCCDLCLKVTDMAKHNLLARASGLCLIYCECTSVKLNHKMTIVAALTDGDIDNIEPGRNGVFYDSNGNDWDATIIKIVDNPISIRQAFWLPYRRLSRFISGQVEKFAASKDKQVETATSAGVEKATVKVEEGIKETARPATAQAAPQPAPQPFDIGKFAGIFAALSIALGAIGSFITSIVTGFLQLTWWKIPIVILGIILIISGPSMILAWLRLRKRNLAPVLDANGWAVNARATINIIFGNTLTHMAQLPEGAKVNLVDPFSKKKRPLQPIILIIIALALLAAYLLWHFGLLKKWGIL